MQATQPGALADADQQSTIAAGYKRDTDASIDFSQHLGDDASAAVILQRSSTGTRDMVASEDMKALATSLANISKLTKGPVTPRNDNRVAPAPRISTCRTLQIQNV
jgi:hypothetical protein